MSTAGATASAPAVDGGGEDGDEDGDEDDDDEGDTEAANKKATEEQGAAAAEEATGEQVETTRWAERGVGQLRNIGASTGQSQNQ